MYGSLANIQPEYGGRFERFGEWELAAHYGNPTAEYEAVRKGIGLLDRAPRSFLRVSGPDRYTWLQGMVSNDVTLLGSDAKSLPACVLSATGHLLAEITIVYDPAFLLLDVDWINGEKVYQLLEQYLIVEDVELSFHSELNCIALQGPGASEQVIAIYEELHPGTLVVPADHTGSGGFDLYIPTDHHPDYCNVNAAWLRFVEGGIQPVGEYAAETLRIEAGIPRFGQDMDEKTIPLEAGLGPTHISHTKGCYVGQEIIHRIHSRGHTNRELTGFVVHGDSAPAGLEKVYGPGAESGKEIGWITSVTDSPAMGSTIALGYLRHEHRESGKKLVSESGIHLTVHDLPFFRRPQR